MKIDSAKLDRVSIKGMKKSLAASGSSSFMSIINSLDDISSAETVQGANSINFNNILSLQEISHDALTFEERQAQERGDEILTKLQRIQLELLSGKFSKTNLKLLEQLSNMQTNNNIDLKLRYIIEEIEIRAAVELAKIKSEE